MFRGIIKLTQPTKPPMRNYWSQDYLEKMYWENRERLQKLRKYNYQQREKLREFKNFSELYKFRNIDSDGKKTKRIKTYHQI